MTSTPKKTVATIIPTLRYNDAAAAVEWLCQAFGFEKHLVVPEADGTVAHAELTFDNGMIMLDSVRDNTFAQLQQPPSKKGDVVTQSPYILVDEVDQHYENAIAAGAEIVMEIQDQDYGGRDYSCRDPEGYLWNFGTYDPWSTASPQA
ncbi:VOC family protein [Pseudanabaena sp. FACHB-2040]|uniref:VOC family protein n=1 Tax=Pseudanabaena sp. FACHB-2040 TaxID=2692859 RepID=UPI001688989F|nr:VOC family protein [Pseudanabaena sp. FACHB-2040]MBD2259360.1 VOC family protein [Pseudanabaena sp. FACHB-2040]